MAKEAPQITYCGALDMQVCVPEGWSDEQVVGYAERFNPCGTSSGWQVRRAGDRALGDKPERVPCSDHNGYVHVMLDA